MSLQSDLTELFSGAFASLGLDASLGGVVVSQRPELGHFQCNGALAGAKVAGRSPRDIASDVVAAVESDPLVERLEIAGPGFINIVVSDDSLAKSVVEMAADERFGVPLPDTPRTVIVDYGGPNVAKELHVGHLRPAVIGESLKRMLRFSGHDVKGDVHLGDWGLQMGLLIVEMHDRMPHLPYFDEADAGPYPDDSPVDVATLNEMYPAATARAASDPDFAERARVATMELQRGRAGYLALWQHFRRISVEAMKPVYAELGVDFDLWLGESSVHDRIAPMLERLVAEGVAHRNDGALIIDVSLPGDKTELPPLIVENSRGASTYATTDLATVEERVSDFGAEDLLYVVDARQALHLESVFRAARKAGIADDDVTMFHLGFGTVNGPGGTPLKTREGNLPLLRDLLADVAGLAASTMAERGLGTDYSDDERAAIAHRVGLAALWFGDLSNHPTSSYVFDLERFTSFEGRTGPYLLYVVARVGSIQRNASAAGVSATVIGEAVHDAERALQLQIARFPEALIRSVDARAPNHLCEYAYETAGAFNRFYENCHILSQPDPAVQGSWLALVDLTRRLMITTLGLVGIEHVERM